MIFVSDQACSSKWWWIGAIRKTRLRNAWKEKTWISTLSASITKMPPITISSTSVFVITASAAIAPPRPSDPVSPMKIDAGNELNQRKPTQAPTRHAATSARSVWRVVNVIAMYASRTIAEQPAASPSRPSVRFTADVDDGVVDAQVERVGQVGPAGGDEPERHRDRHRDQQLPAPAHAERPSLDELHVVVGEAERGACERDPHHADRARVEVGQQQERHRDRGEDDDPAHRRGTGLGVVLLRTLLADLLAELPSP